jgi:hypothetical protein
MMNDSDIIQALMNGNHLEANERMQARELVHGMLIAILTGMLPSVLP